MRDDLELLREHIERNSDEAFRALVERHAGMVHGAALRIVRDAALDCEFECDGFSVRLAQVQADAKGRIIIDVPKEVVRAIQYQARRPDGRIESGGIEVPTTDQPWPPQVVRFPE